MSNCVVGSGGSRLPCSTIAEHGVEGCDHFSHDGDDDDLGFFVGVGEAIVEGFEGGTVSACAEGGHVEDVTDRHPTTVDAAVSLELAAVEVIGCEADEGGDLFAAHLPKFWQQGDERDSQHWADAWHRGQQLIALSESHIGGNHLGQALREFILALGGAAAWPLAVRAQQPGGMRRIGVLMASAADDSENQARMAAFLQGLAQLGWTDGRNVRIDYRWGSGNVVIIRKSAAELAKLAPPDVIRDVADGASLNGSLKCWMRRSSVPGKAKRLIQCGRFVLEITRVGLTGLLVPSIAHALNVNLAIFAG